MKSETKDPVKKSAQDRVAELLTQNQSGAFVGKTLREEGYSADEAMDAMLEHRFTVQSETQPWGTILHVSRKPLVAGLSVFAALAGDSIEVAWRNTPTK